jgi:aminoglycoside 6-adenylyltransferase
MKVQNQEKRLDTILAVGQKDQRIRAVLLVGSRANKTVAKDKYQDFDIIYFVNDMGFYYNNPQWIETQFGKPLIMQMPEAMRFPQGNGSFNYLMIFADGMRLDLSFLHKKYVHNGEPAITLLDKDDGQGFLPILPEPSNRIWFIEPPSPLFYYSCCNNFWWCLNNVAKGIARNELPYVMKMLNREIRAELHDMINWYIGTQHGFELSTGKDGKYFKNYLSPTLYQQYAATYANSDYRQIWSAVMSMCDLFHSLALSVAQHFGFIYHQEEEDGMRKYLNLVYADIWE